MLKKIIEILIGTFVFILALYSLLLSYDFYKNKLVESDPKFSEYKKVWTYHNPGTKTSLFYKDSLMQATAHMGNEVFYDVIYKHNQYGVRDLPLIEPAKAKEHVIFSGCSYTFGEGLNVEDTYPYLIEKKHLDLNTYNLSYMGGGLGTSLHYLEYFNLRDFVKEENGKFVYTFIANHLIRWFARADYVRWAHGDFPYYEVKNRELKFKGFLRDQEFYQRYQLLFKLGLKNSVLDLMNYREGLYDWSHEELKEFAYAVRTLKERYLSLFPKGEFYFLVHPEVGLRAAYLDDLKIFLAEEGILIVDGRPVYDDYFRTRDKEAWKDFNIPHDGHPTGLFNDLLSDFISENIIKTAGQNQK